jgi:hypothetical protein
VRPATENELSHTLQRVVATMRDAAREPLEVGAATLTVSSVKEVYGTASVYDGPVVVLTPRNRAAARVVVEVQGEALWWLDAADGPGYEAYAGTPEDRYALLKRLVEAVVRGAPEAGSGDVGSPRGFGRSWVNASLPEPWVQRFRSRDGPPSRGIRVP